MTSQPDLQALETMVDTFGLFEVLVALDVICGDKADLVRAESAVMALKWSRARTVIQRTALHKSVHAVSP